MKTLQTIGLLLLLSTFSSAYAGDCFKDEDASLRYTGIESHEGLSHYGLFNTVVAIEK